jgi:hypothetical protein
LEADLNAATEKSPYDPKNPLPAKTIDGLKYRLCRVKGEFKTTFDFHDYPFDEQALILRLSNPHLTREQAIYAIDTFGLRLPRANGGIDELHPPANWNFTEIRYIPHTLRSSSTRGHPGAFHGDYETEYSGFDTDVGYTTAIEYGFYAFFALCVFCVVVGLTVERMHARKREVSAARIDLIARISYISVMLAVFVTYYFKYGRT